MDRATRELGMATIAIAVALVAGTASVSENNTRKLEASQVLMLAQRAEAQGAFSVAEEAYLALQGDPRSDVRAEALFRLGKLLASQGQLTPAAQAYRKLLDQKPDASRARLELAGILDKLGEADAALRELRAAQASGLPASVARLVDRYSDALRSRRPFGASVEVAIAPDSNISRATRSDSLGTVLGEFEIADAGKARSGIGLALRGQAFRRIALGGASALLVRLSGSADLYKQTQFNDLGLDIAAGPEFQLGKSRVALEAGATKRWFGLQSYSNSARFAASLRLPVNSTTQARFSTAAGLFANQANRLQAGKDLTGTIAVEHAIRADSGVAGSFSGGRFVARDAAYSTTSWRAGLLAWRDVGRSTVTTSVDFGQLQADERLALFPDRRRDKFTRLSLGATWRQLSFGGFAPVTRVVFERNRSSIEFYDFSRTRTEVGLARAF